MAAAKQDWRRLSGFSIPELRENRQHGTMQDYQQYQKVYDCSEEPAMVPLTVNTCRRIFRCAKGDCTTIGWVDMLEDPENVKVLGQMQVSRKIINIFSFVMIILVRSQRN